MTLIILISPNPALKPQLPKEKRFSLPNPFPFSISRAEWVESIVFSFGSPLRCSG